MAQKGEGAGAGGAKRRKSVGAKAKKDDDRQRLEQLTSCLTEELFEIAMGQNGADGEKKGAATLSERLKAAELIAKYRKNSGEGETPAPPAVIIDDIG